jgi:Tol biopolymer transport system component
MLAVVGARGFSRRVAVGAGAVVATWSLASPAGATPPGANGPIVWQSLTAGDNEIWIMDADGSSQDVLTENTVQDERPQISPDRSQITFMSFRAADGEDSHEIYTMDVDGSNQIPLMDNDDTDFEPSWAPDGSKIVFQRQANGVPAGEVAGQDLWTVPAGGGPATNLTNSPNSYECCAEYSPDGSKIAFTVSGDLDSNPMTPAEPDNEIFVIDSDGSDLTRLTDNSAQDVGPTWSPDGARIAWANTDNGSLWTMDADGSDEAALTAASTYYAPVWSPDGSLIAAQLGNEIVAVSVASPATVTNLSQNGATQDEYPSWAPAGGPGGEPDTEITGKPPATTSKRKARFAFTSTVSSASFECKLDARPYKGCTSPKEYRNLAVGSHRFRVRASSAGVDDPTPAKHAWRIRR